MLTRVPVLAIVAVMLFAALALCQEPEKPEKRPALLSRYGRAVLPRYGKRSSGSLSSSSEQVRDEHQEVICELLDGKFLCQPVDRFRPFVV